MLTNILFYLLLALIPTQVGRHFFFGFSQVNGIQLDYLIPTIYLTDIIIFILYILNWGAIHKKNKKNRIFLIIYLFFLTNILLSANKYAAFYKLFKLIEMYVLAQIILVLKPNIKKIIIALSVGVLYSAIIAIGQLISQKSLGGIFYFLGERSFDVITPSISVVYIFGNKLLRPYATFPHPNVLGGFMAVIALVVLAYLLIEKSDEKQKKQQIFFTFICAICLLVVFISFSRLAFFTTILGIIFLLIIHQFFLKSSSFKKLQKFLSRRFWIIIFILYLLFLFSIFTPKFITKKLGVYKKSIYERADLIDKSIQLVNSHKVFGVGLNNSIAQQRLIYAMRSDIYTFQPVHNLFLLIAAETGLVGLFMFFLGLFVTFYKSLNKPIVFIALVTLSILGSFDHYLFTLQQGQLLATLFISMSFVKD